MSFAALAAVQLLFTALLDWQSWAHGGGASTRLFLEFLFGVGALLGFMAFCCFVLHVVSLMIDVSRDPEQFELEVALDGIRLPERVIPFRTLRECRSLRSGPTSMLEFELANGETLQLSISDGAPIALFIQERRREYERLTAPQARPHPEGYRGVRVVEERRPLVEALRQEGWVEDPLQESLVVPRDL